MAKETFLGSVARAYTSRYDDLSDFCFVFPNRRSGTFFLKRLSEHLHGDAMLAPEVLPMGEFLARIAGIDEAPRIVQLMQLYLAYRDLRNNDTGIDSEDSIVDFDEFLPWGDIVLNDISEVDMYDVDAAAIFKNVVDFRSIASNFLTEEQKDVIERYFGHRPQGDEVRKFWQDLHESGDSQAKDKFVELWKLLPQLYTGMRERLEHPSGGIPLATAGSIARIAMRKVRQEGADALPWKHVVVVGLDWISTTEGEIFTELTKYTDNRGDSFIDFVWDLTGPVMTAYNEPAGRMVRINASAKHFPMPEWMREYMEASDTRVMPELVEIGVPSNAMQAKVAGDQIRRLIDDNADHSIEEARVAVVLPDENLLLPLLYSLPFEQLDAKGNVIEPGLHSVNLTMGWSMRFTSTASFMYHLERIHRRVASTGDKYLVTDLRLLLGQPLVRVLAGSDAVMHINTYLDSSKRRVLSLADIGGFSPELGMLLEPKATTGLAESARWLTDILLLIDRRITDSDPLIKTRIERMQIQQYITALNQIVSAARHAGIDMKSGTMFHLLSRMVGGNKINFEGEPLEGLQVMGLLETRALDFDRVIILSMNDKVMPKRARRRSFIPDSLRSGYGMPLTNHDEARYAYWFYRLLSRAGDVTMIYDSRVGEGMRSGGKSRFLMQLEKLHSRGLVRLSQGKFDIQSGESRIASIPKNPNIMSKIAAFTLPLEDPMSRNLSASALGAYLKCQILFYYRHVLQYGDTPTPTGFIDAITQGKIFHEMMLRLYFKPKERNRYLKDGKRITAGDIQALLDDTEYLNRLMVQCVNLHFSDIKDESKIDTPLSPSAQMVADRLLSQVRAVLRHDMERGGVTLYGGEIKETVKWKVSDSLTVNMTASFDRADSGPSGLPRIVDFKTGSVHLQMYAGLDSVFLADYRAANVFQLLLYAHLFADLRARTSGSSTPENIEMVIFDTNAIEQGQDAKKPFTGTEKKFEILNHHNAAEVGDFIPRLNEVIAGIFDPELPFTPAADPATCDSCIMADICRRG